jgi:putative toxin-antitoxin system antitoxin component (TIGR02293 family)
MLTMKSLVEALGGRKVLRRRITNIDDLRETVKAGLPYASLEALMEKFGFTRKEASAALHLPSRSRSKEVRLQRKTFQADQSDRVLRLARISAQTAETLGSEKKASDWMRRPNRALGNRTPLELLDSDIGTKQVEDTLSRIEHGIIS